MRVTYRLLLLLPCLLQVSSVPLVRRGDENPSPCTPAPKPCEPNCPPEPHPAIQAAPGCLVQPPALALPAPPFPGLPKAFPAVPGPPVLPPFPNPGDLLPEGATSPGTYTAGLPVVGGSQAPPLPLVPAAPTLPTLPTLPALPDLSQLGTVPTGETDALQSLGEFQLPALGGD
ncbi:hypothetical protein RMCBS344292_03162 [Rhizopus microsporus]|nr:hypothetical protein RMCBS344292_03162 [Rhizopus microsporus]